MKKFLIRFGIWFGIVIGLAFPIDWMISSGLRKTDIRKYAAWNDIYKGGLHPDMLVLGSSQAWSSYNTFILDTVLHLNSHNLGMDGHGIDYQLIRYDEFRRFNAKPKVIIVNACFIGSLGYSGTPYEREQFFPYIHNDVLISKVAKTKKITWIDRHLPLIRYFGYREEIENGMASFFGKRSFFDGEMHKGYRGNLYNWDRSTLSRDTLVYASIEKGAVDLLDSFSKNAIEENIQLVFVKYPVYNPLRQKFCNIHQSDSAFESISNKYQIPILDYYYSSISMDSTNYYNPSHLNKKGSEVFTFKLCHDLESLGILETIKASQN